ncbi:unnamed protein product [Cylicocyclus nassatus]|uniref:Ubiquitin-like domain-containing protein n=1 Tax=Cylicocyclus nassatus TaxID=53992 RepID=A0AA36M8A5_CYLNA|nr:unnamed protein product [Cylicocyclus nassatus]
MNNQQIPRKNTRSPSHSSPRQVPASRSPAIRIRASSSTRRSPKSPSLAQRTRALTQGSLKKTPPLENSLSVGENHGDLIEITIDSVMEGVPEAKVVMSPRSTVSELKNAISEETDVLPEKQLLLYKDKVLKDENSSISSYGIVDDCHVVLNLRMSTGSKVARGGNAVLYVPPTFPEGSIGDLRNKIRKMNSLRGPSGRCKYRVFKKKGQVIGSLQGSAEWTPQKQMEHELTRNRMKKLLNKKHKKILSSPRCLSPGSVINSPMMTASPNLSAEKTSAEKSSAEIEDSTFISEKKLKTFFEPFETMEQMLNSTKELTLPPSNMQELEAAISERDALMKTICRVCRKKLTITEQQMACVCTYVFCKKHRNPCKHLCNVDQRNSARYKLYKENPKIGDGGTHKAKAAN